MTEEVTLDANDVRSLLRLLGELREQGNDPAAWRGHLVREMESLFRASVCVASELRVNKDVDPEQATNCSEVVTPLQVADHGLDDSRRARFYTDLYYIDHKRDDALGGVVPLYGKVFTILRENVITNERWEASTSANERFRAHACDDFVMSMVPVDDLGVISSIELFRPAGRRFGAREQLLMQLLHEELARDWGARAETLGVRLTPRQRQVLGRLVEGASEKDIANDLGVSPHTAHDHVKAIHRAFGARSRGELLARVAKAKPPRVRLFSQDSA